MQKIEVKPDLLRWAMKRSGRNPEELHAKFKKLDLWLKGEDNPTYKQLESFANSTYTGLGFFYLPAPPNEKIPISDFRAISDETPAEPNANLLDIIYFAQGCQDFYRRHLLEQGARELPFVGTARVSDPPEAIAKVIRETIGTERARDLAGSSHGAYLKELRERLESIGVTVFIKSHAGNHPSRKLNPKELRGFCLSDRFAPLVFVNGNDSKTAQLFTLMHEVAHIWLHKTGISSPEGMDAEPSSKTEAATIESWCNQVSAEVLMPSAEVEFFTRSQSGDLVLVEQVRKEFLVSPMAAWRQIHKVQPRSQDQYWDIFNLLKKESEEKLRVAEEGKKNSDNGPSPATMALFRLGNRFALAVVESAHAGDLLYTDLRKFLGFSSEKALRSLEQKLGVG